MPTDEKRHYVFALTTDEWDQVTSRANELMTDKQARYNLTVVDDHGRITMAAVGAAIQAYFDVTGDG